MICERANQIKQNRTSLVNRRGGPRVGFSVLDKSAGLVACVPDSKERRDLMHSKSGPIGEDA
jgi:hypothetical protein